METWVDDERRGEGIDGVAYNEDCVQQQGREKKRQDGDGKLWWTWEWTTGTDETEELYKKWEISVRSKTPVDRFGSDVLHNGLLFGS